MAAALLRAFTGFGFAMIAVPVFSLLLLPSEAVVLAEFDHCSEHDQLQRMVG